MVDVSKEQASKEDTPAVVEREIWMVYEGATKARNSPVSPRKP